MKERSKETTAWRYAENGIQLIARLWWVAYIAPSELQPGKWYWKVTTTPESKTGVDDTFEIAYQRVKAALLADEGYDYTLPNDAVPSEMMRHLMRSQELMEARRARHAFDPVI